MLKGFWGFIVDRVWHCGKILCFLFMFWEGRGVKCLRRSCISILVENGLVSSPQHAASGVLWAKIEADFQVKLLYIAILAENGPPV